MKYKEKCKYCGREIPLTKVISHLKIHLAEYEEKEKDYRDFCFEIRNRIDSIPK